MAAPDFDFTGNMARRLLDEHADQAGATAIERRIREARAKHPRAQVTWDAELSDVVVDFTSGGR
ncbi:MAG: hypothetical protein ACRDOI_21180 [Trebonia sp.]